jgi:hypothetical protein
VSVYDNRELLGTTTAGEGEEEGSWEYTPAQDLAGGSHVLQAQARRDGGTSGLSDPLEIVVDAVQVLDPAGIEVAYSVDGTDFVQPYQSANGCLTLSGDGDWPVRPLSGAPLTLRLPVTCPAGAEPAGAVLYRGAETALASAGDGRMAATFDQGEGGSLGVRLSCGPLASELLLGTVAPEFDGFVYDVSKGVLERVMDAKVTLYAQNRASRQWVVWNGAAYHGQTNPVVTGIAGRFAFYPPPGLYRVLVTADGFQAQFGPQQQVTVGPYVANLGLVPMARGDVYLPLARKP